MWLMVLAKVLPVVLLLFAGVVVRKTRLLSETTVAQLKGFVVNFSLPALLFIAFLSTDFQARYLWIVVVTFAVNFVMLAVGKAVGFLVDRGNPYLPLMFTGFEMGMLGFSLFGTVYGVSNLGTFGIFDIGQELYVWFVLTTLLVSLRNTSPSLRRTLVSFATSPVIIAIALGVGLNLSGLKTFISAHAVTGALLTTLTMISQLTIPLVLLIIGFQLDLSFKHLRAPIATLLARVAVLAGIAALIDRFLFKGFLHLAPLFSAALFTMFVLPPPFIVPLFMAGASPRHEDYVTKTLTIGTLLTIVAFAVVVMAFG